MLLYYAFGFLLIAVVTLGLGLLGVAPGAAGIANLAFLVALVLLGVAAFASGHRTIHHIRRLHHR